MRVPSTVNKNCLKAYEPEKAFAKRWNDKKIKSYSLDNWDKNIPKCLQEICIEQIAQNWTDRPLLDEIILLEDRHLLLDILPESLPLEQTIPKIHDEIYWRKCFVNRWPKEASRIHIDIPLSNKVKIGINEINEEYLSSVLGSGSETEIDSLGSKTSSRRISGKLRLESLVESEGRTWKKHYCEMHIKDYLEKLKPEDYNPEKIKELCDLCSNYVGILNIKEMISSENSPNKIPLNAVITGLRNLTEISLKFKQAYARDDFSWDIVNTSYQDIFLLAKGLEKIRLQKLRITNSDIDCDKVIMIVKSLLKHDLEVLDFSHCKIGDRGTMALAKFILENSVKEIYLANNRIGSKGIKFLAYALAQKTSNVQVLDLRLNQFFDIAGNLLLNSILTQNNSLKNLSISGCGLTNQFELAQILNKSKSYLESLDVSNNLLGEELGIQLLEALKLNKTLKKLDIRMCKIPSNVEAEIQNEIYKNRRRFKKPAVDSTGDFNEISWDEDLVAQMDEIFVKQAVQNFSTLDQNSNEDGQ